MSAPSSLIFDIPWISNPAGLNLSSSSAAVLRASRIARTGTRATRVLRLLRTMRMPALLRCCNRDEEEDEHDQAALDPKEDAAHRARREQAALAAQQIDTTVGSKLQLVVSKRVIFLVTLMIFVIPLLQVSTTDYSRPVGLTLTEAATRNNSDAFDTMVDQYLTSVGSSCIYVQVLDLARPSIVPDVSYIRPGSLVNVTSDTVLSWALFDNTSQAIQSSYYTLGMTCFTIVLFAGGSILFTQDAERMFFKPIERMIQKIKRLSAIMFELDATDADEVALDETLLIEAVVTRMSDMFNVRLDRDGVKRKTTMMKTASSRWRIHIEEEEVEPVDLSQPVKNKDLLLSHELEELASLPRCLESPTCMIYLSQYLRHAYCVETVLFLAEVRSFRLASERLAHHARQIYRLFIGDDAVNQVSVAWGVRRAISQNMKTQFAFLADLFEPAEEEVTAALSRDVFPRFLNSIYCLRLLKHMTLERRAQQRRQHQSLVAAATAMHQGDGTHEVAEEQLPAGGLIQLADMDEIKRAIGHEQQ